jgi:hypothetical protein
MLSLILTGLLFALRTRRALALENLALRHQLAVLQRAAPRPRLRRSDRLFWVLLSRLSNGWADAFLLVKPETVIRWHRAGFKLFWTWKSRRHGPGRPAVAQELRALIRRMSEANAPGGGAADSRGASEAGPRDLLGDGLQVHGPPLDAAITDLADLILSPVRVAQERAILS